MNQENNDNIYRDYLIFFLIWMALVGVVLPILDEYLFNYAYKKFLCEYNFVLPTGSSKEWCNMIK
jgi:hypothetical protein